jgi:hypothetical protein
MLKEIYDALKEAGASEEKAAAAAVAVPVYQMDRANLATKNDIADLKQEIAALRLATKNDIDELRLATMQEIAALRTEIERMGRLTIMWNIGTIIAMAGVVFAILRFT